MKQEGHTRDAPHFTDDENVSGGYLDTEDMIKVAIVVVVITAICGLIAWWFN